MSKLAYECQCCGQCCHGQGGIFVEPDQIPVMADFLGLEPEEFQRRYIRTRLGRLEIGVGPDGACLMLKDNRCAIHPVKPKICRDWPFLPGPLTEEWGFLSIRGSCPGFNPEADWQDFLDQYEAMKHEREQD